MHACAREDVDAVHAMRRDACTQVDEALEELQQLRSNVHSAEKTARTLTTCNEVLRERLAEIGVRYGVDVEGADDWQGENSKLKAQVANKEKECAKVMSQLRQVRAARLSSVDCRRSSMHDAATAMASDA
jgi:hypothetical protein